MSADSAAVIAKARCKYGRFLTESDYKTLMSKNDVSDIVSVLRTYPTFSGDFASVSGTSVRRAQAEEIINRRILRIYNELRRFKFGKKDGFYYFPIKRAEIKQIIGAAMFIGAGVQDMFVLQYPVYLNEYSSFDLLALSKARNYADMLDILRYTSYYDVLKSIEAPGGAFPDVKVLESALCCHYFDWILDCINKEFSGRQRDEIKKCFLRSCDMYNISLCYRFKGLFKMASEDVLKYRIPHQLRFSEKDMEQLLLSSENAVISSLIMKMPYFRKYIDVWGNDFELVQKASNLDFYSSKLRLSQFDSVVLYSLLGLIEIETDNITAVIEGVRYSVPESDISQMLILEERLQ